jgi:hypothetical protein
VCQRAGGFVFRPAKTTPGRAGQRRFNEEGVMLDFNELIRMLKNNLIALIVLICIFCLASFRI